MPPQDLTFTFIFGLDEPTLPYSPLHKIKYTCKWWNITYTLADLAFILLQSLNA